MSTYLLKGYLRKYEDDVTSVTSLPAELELAKSLLSSAEKPYLVVISVQGKEYNVKVAKIEKDPAYGERIVLYGYVQESETLLYKNNVNWIWIGYLKE